MRTIVYVDAFNLYFRLLLSASNDITRMKYFTARVYARPNDLDQADREQVSRLVAEDYENAFDAAALITNDSDLLEPVRLVRSRLKKTVGILNPQEHPSFVLTRAASFFKQIRPAALKGSQLPDELSDAVGPFRKPAAW